MKKPRKAYKAKYVAKNPILTFFGGMSNQHADELRILNIKNHGALAAIVQGNGTRDDWDAVVHAINVGNILCERGIGNEYRQDMLAARDALESCGKRIVKTDRVILTGDELKALNVGMAAHDAQLENVRYIDIDRADDEVSRRVRHHINTTDVRKESAKQ